MKERENGRGRVLALVIILTTVAASSVGVALFTLYRTALNQNESLLTDILESRSSLMIALAQHEQAEIDRSIDRDSIRDPLVELLNKADTEVPRLPDSKTTVEFLFVRRDSNQIVFLMGQRGRVFVHPEPVPIASLVAEPARRAIMGQSGHLIGSDYRGAQVLAVYRYIPELKAGIVAKIDMAEIQEPFIKAALLTAVAALLLVSVGAVLLLRIGNQMLRGVQTSEQRLRLALRVGQIGAFEAGLKTGLGTWTPEVAQIWGIPEEYKGSLSAFCWAHMHPEDLAKTQEQFAQIVQSGKESEMEFRIIRPDGAVRWLRWVGCAIKDSAGRAVSVIGVNIDITDRKHAEEQITMLKYSIDVHPEGIYWIDINGRFVYANASGHKLLGYEPNELIGQSVTIVNPRTTPELFAANWEKLRTQGSFLAESIHQRKDGSEFAVEIMTSHLQFGGHEYAVSVTRDITERQRIAAALKDSEQHYRSIFEQAGVGAAEIDSQDGRFLRINSKFCEIVGYSEEEMLRFCFQDITYPEDLEGDLTGLARLRQGGIKSFSKEKRYRRKDDSEVWVTLTVSPLWTEDQPAAKRTHLAIVEDITEMKRLKEQEVRSQRLEAAERIAGQIAHDFNNLLGPLMAYPELMRDQVPQSHAIRPYIDDIETAAGKIAEINQQLLTLSRRGHYSQEVMNVNIVIRQAIRDLGTLPDAVTLQTNLAADLMNVRGGFAQIHRVIMNLLVNARDAIGSDGTITVATANYYADDTTIAYNRVPRGEYIKITIADTGKGIAPDIIARIFDPFFTTKSGSAKRGSGLGLSIVDAVVRDHGGYIDLQTTVGAGTTFYIYFPVTREPAKDQGAELIPTGSESILVVDDDEVQREIMIRLLATLGYHVTLCESGELALAILAEKHQDLLILDMIIPQGIDGTETYRRALQINPAQRAIIVSGYSESSRVSEAQALGAGSFVKKPLSRASLALAVRHELDRGAPAAADTGKTELVGSV